jgi:methyl-accepting chemotaxis protein
MTKRTRLLAVAGVVALAAALAFFLLRDADKPEAISDLERAKEESAEAQSNSDRITARLEDLAENLSAGEDLSGQTDQIGELTQRQRESLEELVRILEGQLEALKRSSGSLEGTESSTETLADLSQAQARLLREAVASLRRLEAAARRASAFSTDVATEARYAARLAEDSQESFEGGP